MVITLFIIVLFCYHNEVQKWKKQYLRYCQETMDYVYIIIGKTCEKKTRGILTGA
jgi:hypothetical protein